MPVAVRMRRLLMVCGLLGVSVWALYQGQQVYRDEVERAAEAAHFTLQSLTRRFVSLSLLHEQKEAVELTEQLDAFSEIVDLTLFDTRYEVVFDYVREGVKGGEAFAGEMSMHAEMAHPGTADRSTDVQFHSIPRKAASAANSMVDGGVGSRLLMIAEPLNWHGEPVGSVVMHMRVNILRPWSKRMAGDLILLSLLISALFWGLHRHLQRELIRPLNDTLEQMRSAEGSEQAAPSGRLASTTEIRALQEGMGRLIGDLAQRVREQEILHRATARQEAFSTTILETAIDGIITIDAQGRILNFNAGASRITGFSSEVALGAHFAELLLPEARRAKYIEAVVRANWTADGTRPEKVEWHARKFVLTRSGEEVPVEVSVQSFEVFDERFYTFFMRDMRDQIRQEKVVADALQHEKLQFDSLATPAMVWRVGAEGYQLVQSNIAAQEFAGGYRMDLSTAAPLLARYPGMGRLFDETVGDGVMRRGEVTSADGASSRKSYLSVTCTLLDTDMLMLQLMDITDIREGELKLVHATKMATLGEMATQIAHEMNQPLHLIRMAANNARRALAHEPVDLDKANSKIDKILGSVERAAVIVERMRVFRREEDGLPFDVASQIAQVVESEQPMLSEAGVEVVFEVSVADVTVDGSIAMFEQLMRNLLENACNALMRVESGCRDIYISIDRRDDANCRLTVTDTGPGIDPALLDRIFEPFFTSNSDGELPRLGLGLSFCYGVITDLGGTIRASNCERGTCFEMVIPCRFENYQEHLLA